MPNNLLIVNKNFLVAINESKVMHGKNTADDFTKAVKFLQGNEITVCLLDKLLKSKIVETPKAASITSAKKIFKRMAEEIAGEETMFSETELYSRNSALNRTKINVIQNSEFAKLESSVKAAGKKICHLIPEDELMSDIKGNSCLIFDGYAIISLKEENSNALLVTRGISCDDFEALKKDIKKTKVYARQEFAKDSSEMSILDLSSNSMGDQIKDSGFNIIEINEPLGSAVNYNGDILNNSIFRHSKTAQLVASIAAGVFILIPILTAAALYTFDRYALEYNHDTQVKLNTIKESIRNENVKYRELLKEHNKIQITTKSSTDHIAVNEFSNIENIFDGDALNINRIKIWRDGDLLKIVVNIKIITTDQTLATSAIDNAILILSSDPYNYVMDADVGQILDDIPNVINTNGIIILRGETNVK